VHQLVGSGKTVQALILDFWKAFDVVPHSLLIQKMINAGIDGYITAWVEQLLTDQVQKVVVQGEASGKISATSGVPQALVVGPKLFVLFLSDSVSYKIGLFAVDTISLQSC
jgi:hypothetical protein